MDSFSSDQQNDDLKLMRFFCTGKNVPYRVDLSKGHLSVVKIFSSWCPHAGEEHLPFTRALMTAAESYKDDMRVVNKKLCFVVLVFLLAVILLPGTVKNMSKDQNSTDAKIRKYRSEVQSITEEFKRKRMRASLLKKRAEALAQESTED